MIKKTMGIFLVSIGLLALITPFTPGAWLIVVGFELLGLHVLFWDKIKLWCFARSESARPDSNSTRLDKPGARDHASNKQKYDS